MTDDNRPIEVGDYVQHDHPNGGRFLQGVVSAVANGLADIAVRGTGGPWDSPPEVGSQYLANVKLCRRIPRPAEAQARCDHPLPWDGGDRGWLCRACGRPTGRTLDDGIAKARACSAEARILRERQTPPAPVLVEGLTVAECRSRWFKNRQRLEPSTDHGMRQPGYVPPPLEPLTPAQITAAKASQAEIEATWWPQQLREAIAASAEAEGNRVRVDPQDEPWD